MRVLAGLLLLLMIACVDKPTEHRVRANAFLRGGDANAALKECELGLKAKPNDVSLLILKGKALFELDRFDDSKVAYLSAVDAGKSDPDTLGEAHLGLAVVATRQEKWSDAKNQFDKLVKLRPRDADAHLNLARTCLQLEEMPCAIKHGEEAGHLRGNTESVLFTLGRIYVVAKKYDDAEKTFQHICEVVPNASSCPYGVALAAAQRGDKKRALQKLEEAIDRKLPNPDKLADDPLIAPLKDDPEFKRLVAKAKSK